MLLKSGFLRPANRRFQGRFTRAGWIFDGSALKMAAQVRSQNRI